MTAPSALGHFLSNTIRKLPCFKSQLLNQCLQIYYCSRLLSHFSLARAREDSYQPSPLSSAEHTISRHSLTNTQCKNMPAKVQDCAELTTAICYDVQTFGIWIHRASRKLLGDSFGFEVGDRGYTMKMRYP